MDCVDYYYYYLQMEVGEGNDYYVPRTRLSLAERDSYECDSYDVLATHACKLGDSVKTEHRMHAQWHGLSTCGFSYFAMRSCVDRRLAYRSMRPVNLTWPLNTWTQDLRYIMERH